MSSSANHRNHPASDRDRRYRTTSGPGLANVLDRNPYGVRMHAKRRVPTYSQASTDVARVDWLAALPDRIEELTARWGAEPR
jgi:hypothetical protein